MKTILERMADLKAAQEQGTLRWCPRCGENTMKPHLHTNALSRQYDIMVCDACGMDEAKMAFMGAPMPLAHWAGLNRQPRDDLKAVPSQQALCRIEQEQIPYLTDLFRRFLAQEPGTDLEAWRLDAYEQCPGLTTLWFEPFEARYSVAEGTLVITYRLRNGTPQYAICLLED